MKGRIADAEELHPECRPAGPATRRQLDAYRNDVVLGSLFGAAGGSAESSIINGLAQRIPAGLNRTAREAAHSQLELGLGRLFRGAEKLGENAAHHALEEGEEGHPSRH